MQVFLAMIAPDHESATVLGAFSTLELAKLAFSSKEDGWEFQGEYDEYWQRGHYGFNDNEIRVLTLDQPPQSS